MPGPDLNDVLAQFFDAKIAGIHTAMPGIIVSYDPSVQKAEIQPAIKRKYKDDEVLSMPILTDVPVIFPRAGGASLTFPVSVGDTVLVICAERSIEVFNTQGGEQEPADTSKFSLSDAVALPGLFPFTEASLDPDGVNATLIFKTGKIVINPDGKIAIGNSAQELLAVVEEFITALTAMTTSTSIGPQPPINLATFTALLPKIAALKGTL